MLIAWSSKSWCCTILLISSLANSGAQISPNRVTVPDMYLQCCNRKINTNAKHLQTTELGGFRETMIRLRLVQLLIRNHGHLTESSNWLLDTDRKSSWFQRLDLKDYETCFVKQCIKRNNMDSRDSLGALRIGSGIGPSTKEVTENCVFAHVCIPDRPMKQTKTQANPSPVSSFN